MDSALTKKLLLIPSSLFFFHSFTLPLPSHLPFFLPTSAASFHSFLLHNNQVATLTSIIIFKLI